MRVDVARFPFWIVSALLCLIPAEAGAQVSGVEVVSDSSGSRLQVDGRDFMIFGMNWDYVPIGENYLYSLWAQPDAVIEAALAREMPLLKSMGVNVIRQYVGIPPRWVEYIYKTYGIYTVINHPMGRYGFTIDGVWTSSVDYADPRFRKAVTAEVMAIVEEFRGVPGMLMWLLGNENNYGLSWTSFEAEALPEGERNAARARYLYSLFNDVTRAIKERDPDRPVAIANGDVQYIDIIAEECPDLDILGTNVYRGISARDLYEVVEKKLGIPVMYTEFGADAWNAKEMREDQTMQARYLLGQWEEIYEQSAGKGKVGNAIGGFIFQWADGWWKFGQDSRLNIHDTNASWPNGGYADFVPGQNNMNEEWWGICAKGIPNSLGLYDLYPRSAYYAVRQAWQLDPYASGTDIQAIQRHFGAIDPVFTTLEARGDQASRIAEESKRVRLSGLRLEFETYSTGGSRISTPDANDPQPEIPSFLGFDHMESFYTDFAVSPTDNVLGTLSLNILGNVALNPIDEIFYENRGKERFVLGPNGEPIAIGGFNRVAVYQSTIDWEDPWFHLTGFYRTGHLHWGFEHDFFGIYRDAYYGDNIDIYNGQAPIGVEIAGKRSLDGFKVAFGPQLWWGANPAVILRYSRKIGPVVATGIYQDDIGEQTSITSSATVPLPPTRTATLQLATQVGKFGFEVGGIRSGATKIDEPFQVLEVSDSDTTVLQDFVRSSDTWGVKGKVTYESGPWHWYGQAAYMGIVAMGGPTATITFMNWDLKDSGWGNQVNAITGLALNRGKFQIGPNFLWQKPIVGPIPGDAPPPGRPRNVLDDPFAVRPNRETVGVELMISRDATPATWMWAWDNDTREDAALAWSLGVVYRHLPTTQDAAIGITETGETFPFPGAPPPRDLWLAQGRIVSKFRKDTRLVAHLYAGTGEAVGDNPRLIHRYGMDARITWQTMAFATFAKFGDWGPYDYQRDFNLTFPVQLMGDLSHTLGLPRWFGYPQTQIGARVTWRSLDQYSPRYCPERIPGPGGTSVCDPTAGGPDGSEWEIRTYVNVSL